MPVSRRKLLALLGGGTIVAAGATAGVFVSTRTPARALAPWDAAGSAYAEPRLRALSWAILAPNPHNRQPWIAEMRGDDGIALWLDTARLLPETDPESRQILIGLGCFLELLRMAAAADGHRAEIALFPEGAEAAVGGTAPVAGIVLRPGGAPDPLFAHAARRRSVKEPFDMARPVASAALDPLLAAAVSLRAAATVDAAGTADLRDLTRNAFLVEAETPAKYRESVDLMRLGRREIEANPDGIDLGGPFLESLMLAGLITREALADPSSTAYRSGIEQYDAIFAATPAFVWLGSPGNSREDQIAAGRDWLRLNLAATAAGLSVHPVSQALQEYAEMAPLRARAHALLARPGETVQMLARLGYAAPVPPSPRWPIEAKMRNG